MSYTVFGDHGSGAFSAEAALAEAGAPYEFKLISLEKNEQRAPEFLAINPSGKMPALRLPEGVIVTESSAILLTIADHFPQARLLPPQASPARGQAYRWISFLASEVYPMIEVVDYPDRFVPKGETADTLRIAARDRVRERMQLVQRSIAGEWMLPTGFSIVDIYAAMFSRWILKAYREEHLRDLTALAERVGARPAIAPIWKRHFTKN
ncbi:MAG: glutathione S-transferase family protein [Alphaproteobacteria bacterium]|nr:glutathione S-transferase family protein [Alphaproteobacteria bacterium]MBV9541402.1 glutathione S-transferase family protein [Alphaproteobacteria bacterium]MBV9905642.1 glutathione S-transferase family protein [Alphaproteobacteria bacterium]